MGVCYKVSYTKCDLYSQLNVSYTVSYSDLCVSYKVVYTSTVS